MAKKTGQQTIHINIQAQFESLQKANAELQKAMTNEALLSKQGNSVKSALRASNSLLEEMAALQNSNGKISVGQMQSMARQYGKVTDTLKTLSSTEKVYQQQTQKDIEKSKQLIIEYNKQLDIEKAKLADLKKQRANSYGGKNPTEKSAMIKQTVMQDGDFTKSTNRAEMEKILNSTTLTDLKTKKNKTAVEKELNAIIQRVATSYKQQAKELNDLIAAQERNITKTQAQIESENAKQAETQESLNASLMATQQMDIAVDELSNSSKQLNAQRQHLIDNGQKEAQVTTTLTQATRKLTIATAAYQLAKRLVTRAVRAASKAIKELDRSLTEMAMVTGMTRKELYDTVPAFSEMAKACGVTITEFANMTSEFMRQGRSMKDSMMLAEEAAKAAKIAGIDVGESVQYLTSTINGFNMEASQAAHVSDVFAKVAAETATDYEQLAISLSKVSAQANLAGMSMEFTTSLLAKGIEVTQEAPESIGTALKTIVARMRELSDYGKVLEDGASVNKVESALNAAGVALRDTNGEFRDLEEIFNELGPKWDGLSTMQQQAIAQAVAGTRQQSRFIAIMQDWDRTLEITAGATDAAGASAYQFSQIEDSLAYKTNELTASWQELVTSLVDTEGVKAILDVANSVLESITKLAEAGNGFVGHMMLAGVVVGTLGLKMWQTQQATQASVNARIQEVMLMQGVNREEAQRFILESKNLTLKEKMVLLGDKEWRQANRLHKTKQKELKQLKKMSDQEQKRILQKQALEKKYSKDIQKNAKTRIKNNEIELASVSEMTKDREKQYQVVNDHLELQEKTKDFTEEQKQLLQDTTDQEFEKYLIDKDITNENGEQLSMEQKQQLAQKVNNAQDSQELATEAGISQEEAEQLMAERQQIALASADAVQDGADLAREQALTAQKGLTAVGNIWSKVHPFVAPALSMALMALLGLGMSGIGAASAAQEDIGDINNDIYEKKGNKTKISSLTSEYEKLNTLKDSGMASIDELNRMKEIEEELHEIDASITGTGADLIHSAQKASDDITGELKDLSQKAVNAANKELDDGKGNKADNAADAFAENEELMNTYRDAAKNMADDLMTGATDAEIKASQQALDSIYASMDTEALSKEITANGQKASVGMEKINKALAKTVSSVSGADDLTKGMDAYQAALSELTTQFGADSEVVKNFKAQYDMLNILSQHESTVNSLLAGGRFSESQIKGLVADMKALGVTSDKVGTVLNQLGQSGQKLADGSKAMFNTMIQNLDKSNEQHRRYWASLTGKSAEALAQMSDEEWKKFTQPFVEKFAAYAAGNVTAENLSDIRTKTESTNDNTQDIIDAILSGEKLSTEQQQKLAEDYAGLYGSSAFQDALRNNPVLAAQMLRHANASNNEEVLANTQELERQSTAQYNQRLQDYGLTSFDSINGFTDAQIAALGQRGLNDEAIKALEAELTQYLATAQSAHDAYESMSNKVAYDVAAYAQIRRDAEIDELKELIDDGGTKEQFAELVTLYTESAAAIGTKIATVEDGLKDQLNTNDLQQYYSVVNGKIIPKAETWNNLTEDQKAMLMSAIPVLEEYYETEAEYTEAREEALEQEKEQYLDYQEQAIELIKARMEAEYEATKESLDRRKELYDKYFDALEHEEDTATYESDRQSLLNRIAALSTATDSTSLAKLKEAQEELAELDKEQLASERELRREAVNEAFEDQTERLDDAYNRAMENSQALWEEYLSMTADGIQSLFEEYGEGFKGATTAAAQVAQQEWDKVYQAILSYKTGGTDPVTGHRYAEGGLVNYTGPAWVDGTRSHPEAFLDAEDTANIAALASGLRALNMQQVGSATPMSADSNITINEINISVQGGPTPEITGQGVADGFIQAMRDLGLGINQRQ